MICPKCGKEIDDRFHLCGYCGEILKKESEVGADTEQTPCIDNGVVPDGGAVVAAEVPLPEDTTGADVQSASAQEIPLPVFNIDIIRGVSQDDSSNSNEATEIPQGGEENSASASKPNKRRLNIGAVVAVVIASMAFLATVVAVAVVISHPQFVIARAYEKTFVESVNYSFELDCEVDGGMDITVDGAYVKGETVEDSLVYIELMKLIQIGVHDGKMYTSFGEFDMDNEESWEELELLLDVRYGIDVDIEGIVGRLQDDNITPAEVAAIFDDEIFPLLEDIIEEEYDEEVEFPAYEAIKTSFDGFFEGFVSKYVDIEEQGVKAGRKYTFEMNIETVYNDFIEYVEDDEALSQVKDIASIVVNEENLEIDWEKVDNEVSGTIKVDKDGCISLFAIRAFGVSIRADISDVNETQLEESDVEGIEAIYDLGESIENPEESEYDTEGLALAGLAV